MNSWKMFDFQMLDLGKNGKVNFQMFWCLSFWYYPLIISRPILDVKWPPWWNVKWWTHFNPVENIYGINCACVESAYLFTPWLHEVQELKVNYNLDGEKLFTWRLDGVRGNFIEVTKWSEKETLFKAYSSDVEVLPRTNHHCSSFICSKKKKL